jgi:AbrB family looped-hinge helix DNA binding protein
MKTIATTVGSLGQVTIPDEVRDVLGVEPGDTVTFVVDDQANVRLTGADWTIATLRGSVPAVPGMSEDFDQEIEEAIGDALAERYRWTVRG